MQQGGGLRNSTLPSSQMRPFLFLVRDLLSGSVLVRIMHASRGRADGAVRLIFSPNRMYVCVFMVCVYAYTYAPQRGWGGQLLPDWLLI